MALLPRCRLLGAARSRLLRCCRRAASSVRAAALQPVPCFYADWAEVPLPEGHRFPMHKYRTTRVQLEEDASLCGKLDLRPSPLVALSDVLRVHCPAYLGRVLTGALSAAEQRTVGFPWSEAHVTRSLASTGGTVAAMHLVMGGARCALQLAGGTHHAFRDRGEGFCVFNDMAVAAQTALVRAFPAGVRLPPVVAQPTGRRSLARCAWWSRAGHVRAEQHPDHRPGRASGQRHGGHL